MPKLSFNCNAKWLWPDSKTTKKPHQYFFFRKEFEIVQKELLPTRFLISADTDFIAYLNGVEFGRGQFSDYPREKTYSSFGLPKLIAGKNIITVLVYYCGENFQVYAPGQAGMIGNIKSKKLDIITDSSWLCTAHHSFKSGIMPTLTSQLGFTTSYDARKDIDYFNNIPDPKVWKNAVELSSAVDGFCQSLNPRPIPLLKLEKPVLTRIVKQGVFRRYKELDTFAQTVSKDEITFTDYDKVFNKNPVICPLDYESDCSITINNTENTVFVVDLGKESVGFITLKFRCAAGTVFDISHGEHLDDGKVRCEIDGRNFTDRYIAKDGLNSYQLPFRRIGGRYIQLNITRISSDIEIFYVGIAPWNLPLPQDSDFDCPDHNILKLRRVAIDTMKLCMHEHYEDCPWREQALYSYDSRNQIIYGYYVWGNYNYVKASLELLGKGIREDGYLNLCAPIKRLRTIPIFSFVWVVELMEYYLYSGNIDLFKRFKKQIEFMIESRLEEYNEALGIFEIPRKEYLWNFYGWDKGLSQNGCPSNEYHALYNLYFLEMLTAFVFMLEAVNNKSLSSKYKAIADKLGENIVEQFWDDKKGCLATKKINNELSMYHEHTQFLALTLDIVDSDKKQRILQNIISKKLLESSLSSMLYMVRGLLNAGPEGRIFIRERLNKVFYPMLDAGATSLWETTLGSKDFGLAGSLCHAWSSLPVYYDFAVILGISPLESGFRKFRVSPCPGELKQASGTIPTPYGNIQVAWELNAGLIDIQIIHPPELTPVFQPYPETLLGNINIQTQQC
jgi:hypothetical protein